MPSFRRFFVSVLIFHVLVHSRFFSTSSPSDRCSGFVCFSPLNLLLSSSREILNRFLFSLSLHLGRPPAAAAANAVPAQAPAVPVQAATPPGLNAPITPGAIPPPPPYSPRAAGASPVNALAASQQPARSFSLGGTIAILPPQREAGGQYV